MDKTPHYFYSFAVDFYIIIPDNDYNKSKTTQGDLIMGAFGAEYCFPGRLTHEQVRRKFRKAKRADYEDAQMNDEPCYGGGYMALGDITFEDTFIKDYRKAVDYCAKRAEKWGNCYAVLTNYKPYGRKRASKHWLVFGWVPE